MVTGVILHPNQSLQQTKPPVTCRAGHGPRQPSSLLKLVLGSNVTRGQLRPGQRSEMLCATQ